MHKNLTTPAVECLEKGNYHVYRNLFPAEHHFLKWIPAPKKLQESGNKQNKIKEN